MIRFRVKVQDEAGVGVEAAKVACSYVIQCQNTSPFMFWMFGKPTIDQTTDKEGLAHFTLKSSGDYDDLADFHINGQLVLKNVEIGTTERPSLTELFTTREMEFTFCLKKDGTVSVWPPGSESIYKTRLD